MTPVEASIALNMLPTMGPVRLRRLLEVFETPERVLSARRDALRAVERELKRPYARIIALSAAVQRDSGQAPNGSCFDLWLTKPVSEA